MNTQSSPLEYLVGFLACVGLGYLLARGVDKLEEKNSFKINSKTPEPEFQPK